MTEEPVVLRELALPGGARFRPLGEPELRIAARVEGGGPALPAGRESDPAWAEAAGAKLQRSETPARWGDAFVPESLAALERLCYERGRSSIDVLRAEPQLLSSLQIGTWFSAGWDARLLRRLLVRVPRTARVVRAAVRRQQATRLVADAWFWAGVRSRATADEWRRLTRSSYVALCYHQLAGTDLRSEHDIDLPPVRFTRQLALLRRLGYQPLSVEDLYAFHDAGTSLPRRRYLLTADDGYAAAVEELVRHVEHRPIAFVVTRFAAGEEPPVSVGPCADWQQLAAAQRAGVVIGAHTSTHRSLPDCGDAELVDQLAGAQRELVEAKLEPEPVVAYPYGHHDARVRRAAIDAGYRLAYTTGVGRNGAGTDPRRLRRITIHGRDGLFAFGWKILTGEALPGPLDRAQTRRHGRSAYRRAIEAASDADRLAP
jgi:peptidoglycan/xylan/chitin deacetylase (PgdA/CDA1 family)